MHLEFAAFVQMALREVLPQLCGNVKNKQSAESLQSLRLLTEGTNFAPVEDCKIAALGQIASPVAFILSQQLAHLAENDRNNSKEPRLLLLPEEVAEIVLKKMTDDKSEARKYFSISVAGGGYLNASPLPSFHPAWLSALATRGGEALLDLVPLLAKTEHQLEEERSFNIDWHWIAKEVSNSHDDELRLFVSNHPQLSFPELLMLFAALGDRELDLQPFSRNLKGSEHIPWYFNRFLYDAERLLAKHKSAAGKVVTGPRPLLQELCEELEHFRYKWQQSKQMRRPDILLRALRSLVQAYYSCYNRPQCRAVLEARNNSLSEKNKQSDYEVAEEFLLLLRLLQGLIKASLGLLEKSCRSIELGLIWEREKVSLQKE